MNKNSIFQSMQEMIDKGYKFKLGRTENREYRVGQPRNKKVYWCDVNNGPLVMYIVGRGDCIENAILDYIKQNKLGE